MAKEERKLCQSCGMPMAEKGQGTEADGKRSADYCKFCYRNGEFTEPHLASSEMVRKVAAIMASTHKMHINKAMEQAAEFVPKLKRWQGGF